MSGLRQMPSAESAYACMRPFGGPIESGMYAPGGPMSPSCASHRTHHIKHPSIGDTVGPTRASRRI